MSACSTPKPEEIAAPVVQTEVRIPSVPASVLTCPPIPLPPDPDTSTQRDVAVYIPDLIEVAEDCRRNLGTVRHILETAQREGG